MPTLPALLLLVPSLPAVLPPGDGESDLWDRLRLSASGRVRAEGTVDQPKGADRYRGRLRLRVGASYRILDSLTATARLSTASDGRDANNPHWDFGDGADGMQGADLVLDRLFLSWAPCGSLDVRAGKLPHAFEAPPVYGEFVWDADVQPAGVDVAWSGSCGSSEVGLRLAEYVVQENGGGDDPHVTAFQGSVRTGAGQDLEVGGATGVHRWSKLTSGMFGNQGNTTVGGRLDQDFTVWDSFAHVRHEGGPLGGQRGFVQYVNNLEDHRSQGDGVALGVELGPRGPGATSWFLVFYDLDANAVFSPVAQDDTPIAGTGTGRSMHGWIGGVRHVVSERLALRLWALTSDANAAHDPWRVRFDLDFAVL